jgi:hypothetical protein
MNHSALAIVFLLMSGSLFGADFDPPSEAFSGSEVAEAMEQAKADQRAILLMYYDYTDGQASWKRRSMDVLEDLESSCIVVYVDTKEFKGLPRKARRELSSDKLGSTYPRAVVMDANLDNLLFPIPQKDWAYSFDATMKDAKQAALSYRRELRKRADRREAKVAEANIPDAPTERIWTDIQGRTLRATLNFIEPGAINVTRDNGLAATILLDQLSEADHTYLEAYANSLFDKRGL